MRWSCTSRRKQWQEVIAAVARMESERAWGLGLRFGSGAPLDIRPPVIRDAPPVPRPEVFDIQSRLAAMQLYLDDIDGILGPATKTAIQALFLNQAVKDFERWADDRMVIAVRQLFCRMDGIDIGDIDGLFGPRSEQAFLVYETRKSGGGTPDAEVEEWRDEVTPSRAAAVATRSAASSTTATGASASSRAPMWPRQSGVAEFFGAPGSNQTSLELPFRMRIAWDHGEDGHQGHMPYEDPQTPGTDLAEDARPLRTGQNPELRLDMFGGCLNVRPMRGGTEWSMHAYGIAWDVDPDRNKLKMGRDQATLDASRIQCLLGFRLRRGRDQPWSGAEFRLDALPVCAALKTRAHSKGATSLRHNRRHVAADVRANGRHFTRVL